MGEITTVGLDLAKHVVSLHAEDGAGRVVQRRGIAPLAFPGKSIQSG